MARTGAFSRTPQNSRTHNRKLFHIIRPSKLFGFATFFNQFTAAAAASGGGDDFSNNLASDLAPVLALFGEQVAKQYMSHSMSKLEDLIFALAPLGVITAITSAIRVGGPGWMKALIGRAREGTGMVEHEVMSSTSEDVGEMFNGEGVVRVLGKPSIVEIYHRIIHDGTRSRFSSSSLPPNNGDSGTDNPAVPLIEDDAELYDLDKRLHNFKSAKKANILKLSSSSRNDSDDSQYPPNLMLNIGTRRVSTLCIVLVIIIGFVLQTGVIVLAGFTAYHQSLAERLPSDDNDDEKTTAGRQFRTAPKYAFPTMAIGTVCLGFGMFFCAWIVNRSTVENVWKIKSTTGSLSDWEVAWIQRGGEVNDQHFNSYFIRRSARPPAKGFFQKMSRSIIQWLSSDTFLEVRTSRKRNGLHQFFLTIIGVFLALSGFVAQFTGLRGLNWIIAVAQLSAIAIMCGLRAMVRRYLAVQVLDVEKWDTSKKITGTYFKKLLQGFELEQVAQELSGCAKWVVLSTGGHEFLAEPDNLAKATLETRCKLGNFTDWDNNWRKAVQRTIESIEVSMNKLFEFDDCPTHDYATRNVFSWNIMVQICSNTNSDSSSGQKKEFHLQKITLSMERKWASDQGWWGFWKIKDPKKVEALFGLWMLNGEVQFFLNLGKHTDPESAKKLYQQWIPYDSNLYFSTNGITWPTDNIFFSRGIQASLIDTETQPPASRHKRTIPKDPFLGIILTDSSQPARCGQILFGEFFAELSARYLINEIGGKFTFRSGGRSTKSSFGIRSSIIDSLVNAIEETGLATSGVAYSIIVTSLARNKRLPNVIMHGNPEVLSEAARIWQLRLNAGRFDEADALLRYCLDVTETAAKSFESSHGLDKSAQTYLDLNGIFHILANAEDFTRTVKIAIRHFVERACMLSPGHYIEPVVGSPFAELLGILGCASEELQQFRMRCTGPPPEDISIYALTTATDDEKYFKWEIHPRDGSPEPSDWRGRTALILASRCGNVLKVRQLLDAKYEVTAKDYQGRSALHYAAMRGHLPVIRLLASYAHAADSSNFELNHPDKDGLTPLDHAFENLNGEAAAILRYYGASDSKINANEHLEAAMNQLSSGLLNADTGTPVVYGRSRIHWAIWYGSISVTKAILHANPDDVNLQDDQGKTPLHYAASQGSQDFIKLLLGIPRADVNKTDKQGWSPLFYAAANSHRLVIEYLLDNGADLAIHSSAGGLTYNTAIQAAIHQGTIKTIRLLHQKSGNRLPEAQRDDDLYLTNLQAAAYNGCPEITNFVLQQGTDVNERAGYFDTAIQAAAASGSKRTLQILLDKGARPWDNGGHHGSIYIAAMRCGNSQILTTLPEWDQLTNAAAGSESSYRNIPLVGLTPHQIAQMARLQNTILSTVDRDEGRTLLSWGVSSCRADLFKKIVEICLQLSQNSLIQQAGVPVFDVNQKDRAGRTALSHACETDNEDIVKILLDIPGIDINSRDGSSRTPLHWAAASGRSSIVKLLMAISGIQLDLYDDNNQTPTSLASSAGYSKIKWLLSPRKREEEGIAALYAARIRRLEKSLETQSGPPTLDYDDEYPI